MSGPTDAEYCRAAERAADAWRLGPVAASVLAISENVVLRLEGADRYVMRLHRPGYNSRRELDSEVEWVRSLRAAGIAVPRAVPTPDGEFYREVHIGSAAGAGEVREAGVVEWIEGRPLGGHVISAGDADEIPAEDFARLGSLMGRIRLHGRTWTPPSGFLRRRWDVDGLVGDAPLWGRFWEADHLTDAQVRLFAEVRNRLRGELSALPLDDDTFGLIHADLHLRNVMVEGSTLTAIDFDDSGWGWAAHEIAVALHQVAEEPWYDRARDALLSGYDEIVRVDDDLLVDVDTFLTVRALMIVGWLADRPEASTPARLELVLGRAVRRCEVHLGR